VPRPRGGSTGRTVEPSSPDEKKPEFGARYFEWLEKMWQGDLRELREGRYLHQQADLRQAFESSDYWREVSMRLDDWAETYRKETKAALFLSPPTLPKLASKPWQSFMSRTWRENVSTNENWPKPPKGGWWLPDNWFERAWDVVRTRLIVRYMDGVRMLASELVECAEAPPLELPARDEPEAKLNGYYAFHVYVRQTFEVVEEDTPLECESKLRRSSEVEIQVMTQLAEVISELTHTYYENSRLAAPGVIPPLWDEDIDEAQAIALSHQSSAIELQVMSLRARIRERTGGDEATRKPAEQGENGPHAH
jgi:ppGpp synthetase/RelA/SpoT-type nucleotidyltranferase